MLEGECNSSKCLSTDYYYYYYYYYYYILALYVN
jgi:hypothetical protein